MFSHVLPIRVRIYKLALFNQNYRNFRVWEQLLKISGNEVCCDCGDANPRWASINLGITLCIGKHHELYHYN
jgi:Arf-GAP/coiled-coil/ANK repeat/PH domain-containing protein